MLKQTSATLLLLSSLTAFGNTATQSQSPMTIQDLLKNTSASFTGYMINKLENADESVSDYSARIESTLGYKVNSKHKLYLDLAYDFDLDEPENNALDDSLITYKYYPGEIATSTGKVSFQIRSKSTLPTAKENRSNSSIQFSQAVEGRSYVYFDKISKYMPTVLLGVGYKKNFHEYKTTTAGESNISRSLYSFADVSVDLTEKLSIGTYLKLTNPTTYNGNTQTTKTLTYSYIGYSITDKVSAEIAFLNADDLLSADKTETELEYFKKEDAILFMSLSMSL